MFGFSDEWIKCIADEKKYFEELSEVRYENGSVGREAYGIIGTGVDGSFKKLNIDWNYPSKNVCVTKQYQYSLFVK